MATKFQVRLESPDTFRADGVPHFRVVSLSAADAAGARAACEQKERELAAHRYPDADVAELEQAEADALDKDVLPPGAVRGRLGVHRQELPYTVVSVEEVS